MKAKNQKIPKKAKKNQEQKIEEEKVDSETKDLYQILNIDKQATQSEIKKGYYKLCLQYHPDKNKDDPKAKDIFQEIVKAYGILGDENKRKIYDETGSFEDDLQSTEFNAAYEYFRQMYKKVSSNDIEEFAIKYRNSEEEQNDLITFYNDSKGDITKILENIMLSRNEDADRFIAKFEQLIDEKILTNFKKFQTSKKKIKLLNEGEEEEAEEVQQELNDLQKQIMLRQQARNQDFLQALEDKYSEMDKKQKKPVKNQESKVQKKIKKK